jgi:hypothetical protein
MMKALEKSWTEEKGLEGRIDRRNQKQGRAKLTHRRDQVRAAYKRESLRTHPDRLPGTATPQDRRKATERFVS